ncbi:hypothetical protein SAMN02927914_04354 [Mesorhizobium qingshengii]|uniref:Uncharacterized protein n=2 Tax=Mesorhizobium qingshengii TaxID=1165689 RepID=A0A1G5Z6J9_9HYPH|nr:hypothetical protein SAMN02927914_04354 [Mesorhizobium qingshengii]
MLMAKLDVPISAFDTDILRSAFMKSVIENGILEDQCDYAAQMIRDFTGKMMVDLDVVDWIVRTSQSGLSGLYSGHEATSASRHRE